MNGDLHQVFIYPCFCCYSAHQYVFFESYDWFTNWICAWIRTVNYQNHFRLSRYLPIFLNFIFKIENNPSGLVWWQALQELFISWISESTHVDLDWALFLAFNLVYDVSPLLLHHQIIKLISAHLWHVQPTHLVPINALLLFIDKLSLDSDFELLGDQFLDLLNS